MEQRVSLVTLGVSDLKKSCAFYVALGWKPEPIKEKGVVFFQCGGIVVGLYPMKLLAEDGNLSQKEKGFGGIVLAYNVNSKEEVHKVIEEAEQAGATITKTPQDVFWGGYHAYFTDIDGHPWEVAYNPFAKLKADGSFAIMGE